MEGILGVIGTVLGLILWWLKHRESPEAVRQRILEETKESLDELGNAIARDDKEDIRRWYADTISRILRKTSGDNAGRGNTRLR